jgi:hypothetical protein
MADKVAWLSLVFSGSALAVSIWAVNKQIEVNGAHLRVGGARYEAWNTKKKAWEDNQSKIFESDPSEKYVWVSVVNDGHLDGVINRASLATNSSYTTTLLCDAGATWKECKLPITVKAQHTVELLADFTNVQEHLRCLRLGAPVALTVWTGTTSLNASTGVPFVPRGQCTDGVPQGS